MRRTIVWLLLLLGWVGPSASLAQTVQLPRTGQSKCYDTAGIEINCAGTGQDGDIRAGVAWPEPRFTLNGDCITDNLTGLMWARNGNPHDYQPPLWNEAIDYANDSTLCGYSDWRVPNINELQSLYHAGEVDAVPWLLSQGFTNLSDAWSSTTVYEYADAAWGMGLSFGQMGPLSKDGGGWNIGCPVLSVRGTSAGPAKTWKTGQTQSYRTGDDGYHQAGAEWPDPRFVVLGDCVGDRLTGLMWSRNANLLYENSWDTGQRTWQQALDYANSLNLCGYTDWRLPNRTELMSLIDRSRLDPALPAGHPFTNVQHSTWYHYAYWSSSTFPNAQYDSALIVSMSEGTVGGWPKSDSWLFVWPVRNWTGSSVSILSGPVVNPTNGHTYYLLTSDYWEPSEAFAVSLGGHLVTINDQAENDWVWDTFASFGGVSRTLWTGYHRLESGGPFVWASGETPGFVNWQPGEPNNATGNEDYAAFVPPGQSPTGKYWFDMFAATTYFWDGSTIHGVVEIPGTATAVPALSLPGTLLLIAGLGGLLLRGTRRSRFPIA